MQRHTFTRAFKFTSFSALMLFTVLLTGTLYAAPKVGPVTPENSIIGQNANDQIGSGGIHSLPNGNIVIVSPSWNNRRGAVTCLTPEEYKAGGIVVSASNSLVGSTYMDGDLSRIQVLANGNYVVLSFFWDNGSIRDAGAVTWVNGTTCIPYGEASRSAVINPANSLVGTSQEDQIGWLFTALPNGNYVTGSYNWRNGTNNDAGAVTWGNGAGGTVGPVSPANSLVGSFSYDDVGMGGITALTNGNYVVTSYSWEGRGAVTWGNGLGGTVGYISEINSLVGSGSGGDYIGNGGVTALANGNYVVNSSHWSGNGTATLVGAITWGNGLGGTVGFVSPSNSLVGSTKDDKIGDAPINGGHNGVIALSNGNYVVASPYWNDGASNQVGAVTWGDGDGGTVGVVSASNSLIGSVSGSKVGYGGITTLSNGNYVVSSPFWGNGATLNVGAATWGDGESGTVGVVGPTNSLIGSTAEDHVGDYIVNLRNGNYVVSSHLWDNGITIDVGAVTWGNGNGGTVGTISPANSLVGTVSSDRVGSGTITSLSNGNYVLCSPYWNNGDTKWVGAVTWGNGDGSTVGVVSPANSLIGSTAYDRVGYGGVFELTNGHYVVSSHFWDNENIIDVGAVTWVNGETGTAGVVSLSNSLVGSTANDKTGMPSEYPGNRSISLNGIFPLSNGNYVVRSLYWKHNGVQYVGAVTWANGEGGTVGKVRPANSLVGSAVDDSFGQRVTPLADGSYLASSAIWDGAAINIGIVVWLDAAPPPPNNTPILNEIGNQSVDEGATLTFDAEATDPDIFAQVLTFSITGAPEDASFNTSTGEFSWIPDEADGGKVFNVTVAITDDGVPYFSDSEAFTITVNEVNVAPVLAQIGNQTVDEGESLTFDAEVTDSDLPASTLTFSIDGAPEDASFDTATGVFSWTTDESDGGQTSNVTVTVTDNGTPALSDSEAFTITVNEVNNAPVLAEIGNKTVDVGDTLTFDVEATDSDDPAQTLTFSIDGAPEDASFDTSTGEFSWTSDEGDSGQTFNVTVSVTDDGEPALSDSEAFTITVIPVVVEETNYLPNPGFENPGTTNKTAAGWNGVGLTKNDKRVCDTETKTYALDGECAFRFQFNGASKPTRTLQRNLNTQNFAKNEALELRGMVKANGLTAGARLVLKIVYNNGKTEAVNAKLTPGNYEYSLFATPQITLKRPAKKITAQIRAGSAKGIFLVDDMAVVKVAAPLTIEGGTPDSGLRGLR